MPLSKPSLTLIAIAGMTLALGAGSVFATEHEHEHAHAAAPAALTLNDGRKWGSDEALRTGMENIRNALDASLQPIHEGKLAAAGYAALARKMNEELGHIVAHCQLEAQADAQLHLVIAEIGEGIAAMAGKTKQVKRRSGAIRIIGALEKYASHFDHPGWQAIRH